MVTATVTQAQPTQPVTDVAIEEPVLQNANSAPTQKVNDVSDIVKKWSTKT